MLRQMIWFLILFMQIFLMDQVSKGNYAASFSEFLRTNRIWDINHSVYMKYFEFLTDAKNSSTIDTIELNVNEEKRNIT